VTRRWPGLGGKATINPQKLESARVKEHGVLSGIKGAPVIDDSAHVTLTIRTTTNLIAQDQTNVLHARQSMQNLDEEMKVAVETWEAAQEFVLKLEEQVKMRQLKV